MKKLKILIVAPYCSLPNETHDNRFLYMSNLLAAKNSVTLITSDFRHSDKVHRLGKDFSSLKFEIVTIHEPGYINNVSLKRVLSHRVWLKNFKSWMEEFYPIYKFDIVYSAYPFIASNIYLGKIKNKFGFKLVVDVQDVWPESIVSVFSSMKFIPWSRFPFCLYANKAYKSADALVAVSQTYLDRAKLANCKVPALCLYIGADLDRILSLSAAKLDKLTEIGGLNLIYLGSLGHSYDIETMIIGVNQLSTVYPRIYLHLIGAGPNDAYFKSIAGNNVIFHGFVDYDVALGMCKSADILINPIKSHALQSITNKLSDYFCVGKPILNSQRNPEVKRLLELIPHFNYDSGNVNSFCQGVEYLIDNYFNEDSNFDNKNILQLFDRVKSYRHLQDFLEKI